MAYITVPFDRSLRRDNFSCGHSSLDEYLQKQVSQDIKKKLSLCFVLRDELKREVIGYYTLANGSIPYAEVPEQLRKKYPRSYHYIPVTLLGRLALNKSARGKGFGGRLLVDALKRSAIASETSIASVAVVADPIDEIAEQFYLHFGFVKLPDSGRMFLNMKTIKKLNL